MTQERFTNISIIAIESEITDSLNIQEVIKEFTPRVNIGL